MRPIRLIFKPYDTATENEGLLYDEMGDEVPEGSINRQIWCYQFSSIPRTIIGSKYGLPFRASNVDFTASLEKGLTVSAFVYGPIINAKKNSETFQRIGSRLFTFNGVSFDGCPFEINDILSHELRNIPEHGARLVKYILRNT